MCQRFQQNAMYPEGTLWPEHCEVANDQIGYRRQNGTGHLKNICPFNGRSYYPARVINRQLKSAAVQDSVERTTAQAVGIGTLPSTLFDDESRGARIGECPAPLFNTSPWAVPSVEPRLGSPVNDRTRVLTTTNYKDQRRNE